MRESMAVKHRTIAFLAAALLAAACQPTVKVEAPDKPIVINLNVKIEQEVRIKVEKEAEQLLEQREDIF
jgi:hypothetical protein